MVEEKSYFVILNTQEEKFKIFLQQLKDLTTPEDESLNSLIATLSSSKESIQIAFEDYFKLLSKAWDHPDHTKDTDFVTMDKRMEDAAPYNVFFNSLKHCPETKEQLYSIGFTDLLCPSLGKLKCSLHVTFVPEIWWILSKYASRKLHKLPMTIIHGCERSPWPTDVTMKALYPDVDYHFVDIKDGPLGGHHSKLSMFVYEDDSLRLVVGTANLYAADWDLFNQQLWISPRCPKLPEGSSILDGESPTGFKLALLDYLFSYNDQDIPSLPKWIDRVKNTDFQEIKVAFLYTVSGSHYPRKNGSFVHYLGHLLSQHCTIPAPKEEHDSWRIVAQTGSLGLMGVNPDVWLTTNLLKSLGSHSGDPYFPSFPKMSKVKFNLVYPTIKNCLNGYFGYRSAGCCMYDPGVKEKQPWLLQYQCQWKAERTKRTRAIAHSKCYFRISPCWSKMPYMFLTSGNLSRSAFGSKPNSDCTIFIRSFETGVLFLPKFFGEEYFEVSKTSNQKNRRLFPIMFDLPLTPYGPDDDSYCKEELERILSLEPDSEKYSNILHLDPEGNWNKPEASRIILLDNVVTNLAQAQIESAQVLVNERDMKYRSKPTNNMFFPDFKK